MKKLLLKSMLLLCALIVGTSSTWATDVTYTITSTSAVSTSGTAPAGSTASFSNTYTSNKFQMTSGKIQTLTLSGYAGCKITQIKLSMHSNNSSGAGKLYYSTDGGTNWTYLVGTSSAGVAFNNSAWYGAWSNPTFVDVTKALNAICTNSNTIFKIEATSNSLFCQSYTITYQAYDPNQVATPTISIPTTTPFVSSKVVTMECETDGASIYYTTDGSTTPTTNSTLYDPSNKPSISTTTTIKAIAVKEGQTESDVTTETFTKETVLDGISALNAATTSNTATAHYVNLTNAQITYVDTNGNNGFLNDANAGVYLFGLSNNLILNTKYNGVYKITSKTFHSWPEVTKFETITGEGSSEIASDIAPIEMTASALETNFSDNLSRQIKIKNHTLSGNKLTSGITIVTTYLGSSLTDDGTYTLIGYPALYDTGKRFYVVTAYPKPATPTFAPVEGEFSEPFTLHLACATDGVAIYYTTDGTTPTTSSTLYNDATGIAISTADVTVKAIAYYQDMTSDVASATYTYKAVAKPLFATASGTEVYYGTKIAVTCATDGAALYYTLTTDGNDPADPTNASTAYPDGGIPINANSVKIKVVAEKNGDYSSIASATYTLKDPAAPIFSVEEGAVARNSIVTISSAEGTTIYYTTDGSDADTGTDAGSNSVNVTITDAMTLKAIAVDPELNMSAEASATYTIAHVATPIVEPAEGIVPKGTQVTITTATDGATIYYTLDGTTPTASSNVYTSYVVINKACTLKAIALKENYINSEVASAAYTVAGGSEGIVSAELGYSNGDDVETVNGTNVTYTFDIGKNGSNSPKYYTSGSSIRIYSNNTLNIASTKKITSILFVFHSSNTSLTLPSGQPGSLSNASDSKRTWTGNTNSVTFSASNTTYIKSITVYFELSDDNVTVGSSKLAGFCSEYKLDFSKTGLSAYKAKVSGDKVVLTKIVDGIVPANTGVILNGDANDYDLPITTADATTDFSDNEMVGVTQRTQVLWNPSADVYNYILQGGEFKKASNGYLKPNRAYLSTSYNVSAASAREYLEISFEDDDVTGIDATLVNSEKVNSDIYDLQGRKVEQPQKGLYIVNGKKVIIK